MKWLAVIVILCSVDVSAQPRLEFTPRRMQWEYSEARAFFVWNALHEESAKDTIINLYVKNSIFFTDPTVISPVGGVVEFRLDSIRGRGASREGLITVIHKSPDSTRWIQTVNDHADTSGAIWDTSKTGFPVAYYPHTLDTVGRTTDSTRVESAWRSWTYIVPEAGGKVYNGWVSFFPMMASDSSGRTLIYFMEKIIGDPAKYSGWNQMARMHFQYFDRPPQVLIDRYGQ